MRKRQSIRLGKKGKHPKGGETKPSNKSKAEAVEILRLIKDSVNSKTALAKISSQDSAAGSNPFKVLISTMLSARTRDPVTEAVSSKLFGEFPDPFSLSRAKEERVRELIRPVLYYNVKTARIIRVSKILVEEHGGIVPDSLEQLLELPGVGRKTANCVLVYAFSTPAIPVDVHVHRVSNRIGLVRTKTPEETEVALTDLYERKYWLNVNELFVSFGQTVCKPIVPMCAVCAVRPLCDYYNLQAKRLVAKK